MTGLNPADGAFTIDSNLRIASLTIAAYDYLITLPAEIRLYRSSSRRSLGFILFILIRYTSVLVMFTSNFGFFYHHFTPKACSYYFYVAPVFKVIQLMVSQAILGVRTYNVTQRNTRVGRIIVSAYSFTSVLLWFTALYDRRAEMTDGNCTIGSAHPRKTISAWSFYLIAMLYDVLVLFISTTRLLKLRGNSASSGSSRLLNILLYDGLGYFVALTAVNFTNVLLYRGIGSVIQTSGTSLEYVVIWIMSQWVLLHLREERARQQPLFASQIPRANLIAIATGPHLHRPPYRSRPDGNATVDLGSNHGTAMSDSTNVGVRIERAIIRDAKPLDEESDTGTTARRDLYAPAISIQVWDEINGKRSEV